MPSGLRTCPYCHQQALTLHTEHTGCYLECHHCGARGPRTAICQQATMHYYSGQESLLRSVIDESPDIILMKNWHGEFLLCNQTLARLYGTTPEAMLGKSDADFNPNQEQVQFYLENIQAIMRAGDTQVIYEQSTDAVSGEVRHFQSIKKPLRGADGSHRILVIAHDITELQRAHQLIEEKEKRYAYAMEAADVGIWDWDIPSGTVTHNSKWCQLLGLDQGMSQHDMAVLAQLIHPDDQPSMMAALNHALQGGSLYQHEQRMLRANGEVIWIHDRGRVMEYDEAGQPIRMVGSMSDITVRKQFEQRLETTTKALERTNARLEFLVSKRTAALERANRELQTMAFKDPLTGISNRIMLDNWLAKQCPANEIVLLMADVDHFKTINDRFGHKVGDQALVAVAQTLVDNTRQSDLVVRWGGEEFLIVLTALSSEQGFRIAEALRQQIAALELLPEQEKITLSMGLASGRVDQFDQAMTRADQALYHSKRAGRNQTTVLPESG